MKWLYFTNVDGFVGCLKTDDGVVRYAPQEKFVDFVLGLRKEFPEYKMKYVINEGIYEAVKEEITKNQIISRGLSLNCSER